MVELMVTDMRVGRLVLELVLESMQVFFSLDGGQARRKREEQKGDQVRLRKTIQANKEEINDGDEGCEK